MGRNKDARLPPSPPEFARKTQLHRVQLIGMPMLMLLSILALFGFFGETSTTEQVADDTLTAQVSYVTRARYSLSYQLEVALSNQTTQPLSEVEILFPKKYIDGFSNINFMPVVETITDQAYILKIRDLQPAETRVATVSLQGNRYGHQQGAIGVTAGVNTLQLPIDTWIFP